MNKPNEFFNSLPKCELHRHLDGNIKPATICRLAKQYSVELPTYDPQEFKKYCQIQDKTSNLMAFLEKLDYGVSVLGSEQACFEVAFENVQDAIDEGLDYVELRFSPVYMARAFNLSLDHVISSVIDGINSAASGHKIILNLIGILSRTFGVRECANELDALLNFRNQLCAIDLAGDELTFPAHLFKPHFQKVHQSGLNVTIHAGEADGPVSIWSAINDLGAQRIGHGVAATQDKKLMNYLRDNKIGIESCITSNYQTGTVMEIKNHPLKQFLLHGIEVSLSTDDPGVSNITLDNEFQLAELELNLTDKEIMRLKHNAISQAFISEKQKIELYPQN